MHDHVILYVQPHLETSTELCHFVILVINKLEKKKMSLRSKRVVFEKVFAEFRQDLEKMFNFSGLDRVSGMKMYQYPFNLR
jgi:hypothetical protein